jgi:hypothetical protein
MALVRHWYPTGNYSSGGNKRLLVIHTTEGFTGSNGMYDCAIYFQGNVGASSHVIIDNFHPGHICEGVAPQYSAWTQCNYNSQTAASVEQCAYAAWSRSEWLNSKEPLLRNTAAWLAEESARFGIPLTELTDSQSQGSGRGVTYHSRLGSAGCGHSDPGSGYPLDVVLDWARGGGGVPPEEAAPPPDHVVMPGRPGNWKMPYHEFAAADGTVIGAGVGTDGGIFYNVLAHGATAWRGPTRIV